MKSTENYGEFQKFPDSGNKTGVFNQHGNYFIFEILGGNFVY